MDGVSVTNTDAAIAAIADEFSREWDYGRLGVLSEQLLRLAPEPDLPEQGRLLLGAILNRRRTWYEAADVYARIADEFPDNFIAPYEAALNGIDAGRYDVAIAHFQKLGERLDRLPNRNLRGVWRGAAAVGLHDLSRRAFDMAVMRGSDMAIPAVSHRIDSALAAQTRKWARIISVGENCQPWMLITRWGLRRHPERIDQHAMFNLGQGSIDSCAQFILARGAGMIDSQNLRVAQEPGAGPRPVNHRYGYDFNHEMGERWLEDDFARLKARYAERIASFHTQLSGEKRVFLFYTEHDGDLNRLVDALVQVNEDSHFVIVIVDIRSSERAEPLRPNPHVHYARLRPPRPDYVWYKPDDHDSTEGVYFEQVIRDLVAVHADLGPADPPQPVAEKPKGWRLFGR